VSRVAVAAVALSLTGPSSEPDEVISPQRGKPNTLQRINKRTAKNDPCAANDLSSSIWTIVEGILFLVLRKDLSHSSSFLLLFYIYL
jgi:hypothetical protein